MLETASKSLHNWRRYLSSKYYEIDKNVRFRIWRSAVVPSYAAEKNGNVDAQLQSPRCTKPQRYLGKYASSMTFGAQRLVRS